MIPGLAFRMAFGASSNLLAPDFQKRKLIYNSRYLLIIGGMIGSFWIPDGSFGEVCYIYWSEIPTEEYTLFPILNIYSGVDVLWDGWRIPVHPHPAGPHR